MIELLRIINNLNFFSIGLLIYSLFTSPIVFAEEYRVASAKEIKQLERSLKSGDVVILKDGTWHDQAIKLTAKGDIDKPIRLKAETLGRVVLTGNSSLLVKGSYVVVSGLLFANGALEDKKHVIRLEGNNHRLTQSAIINYNPKLIDTRYFWLSLLGDHHRVDHNLFSGQNHSGVTTVVWLSGSNPGFHQIDHNYYGQRPKGNGNGFETIRIGTGRYSRTDSHVLVENNVFEETDGEIEIISNKSNYNTYRGNTFLNSAGTLTIRQGTHNIVDSNYFLGLLRKGSGGVRVISTKQLIINNHFERLAGRAEGIISITAGNGLRTENELPLYPRVENSLIIGNVCINNEAPCFALNAGLGDRKRTLIAENLLIANNMLYRDKPDFNYIVGQENDSIVWFNNMAHGSADNDVDGIFYKALSLEKEANQISEVQSQLLPFSCNRLDVLLSEEDWGNINELKQLCIKSESIGQTVHAPLLPKDVGPEWLKVNEDGGRFFNSDKKSGVINPL